MKYEIYLICRHCQPTIKLLKDIEPFHDSEAGQIEDYALEVRIEFGLSGLLPGRRRSFQCYHHPLPIIKFGSHVAICGKANKIIKATISAERNGTTPL